MRSLILILSVPLVTSVAAQSGPGGIGSSTNNVLWLDANSGVSHLLGLVSQWDDRSGNGNNAYVPGLIPLATPYLTSSAVNGYPALDFDGIVDQLWVNDHSSLDLTQWHFFIVVKADVQKDYNAWMAKGDDSDENFEMLSYSDGNIHTPIKYTDGSRTVFSTPAGQVTTTDFNLIEYSYASAVGRDVYKNGTNVGTDNENKTPKVNNQPLYIGNEQSTTGRNISGDLAEVIAYNAPLNSAQRIIVNNYLAAKYARSLGANDLYINDDPAQGNFDHDVSGIGRVNATNLHNDSKGSGVVRISNPTGLGNTEFLFWGHDGGALGTFGVADLPAGVQGRWARVWRVSEVNTSGSPINVGAVDMTFDLSSFSSVTASDLRLLVDTDGDAVFADETPISGATSLGGGQYRFAGVTALVNGRRFTLGTIDIAATPLPIELSSFSVLPSTSRTALIEWVTASERDNDHFTVERSTDTQAWYAVADVAGAGNSMTPTYYSLEDGTVPDGVSYYRLRQFDFDGTGTVSHMVVVDMGMSQRALQVFPNPSSGVFTVQFDGSFEGNTVLSLLDATGRVVVEHRAASIDGIPIQFDAGILPKGVYVLRATGNGLVRYVNVVLTP